MPSIVVTPKYNPFTFDELYRPLAETTKMQMALEDQYNAMEMEAAKLDYLKDSDQEAYAVVKNYKDTLRGLAGELASKGLDPQSRQGVYDMRESFASKISPINKYITWREAQDKARQEIMMKDPTYRWEIPLDQVKYNTWRDNPDMLFRGLSGDTLAKMAQTSIQHITKRWRTDPEFKALKGKAGLEDYVQKIEEYGMSVEDMLNLSEAIANRTDLTEEQKKAINNKMAEAGALVREQVINSTDIPQWSNYKDLESPDSPLSMWIDSNIERGLWAGIGEQKDQILHNANAEGKTGQGTETNINRDTVEWERIANKKDPKFTEDFNRALYGQYNFEDTINSIMQTVHSILPSVPTFNGSFADFVNTPFVELGKKFDITDTSALANSKMLLQKKAPTLAMTNMIYSKWSTTERLKVLDVLTSGMTGGFSNYDDVNKDIDKKYKEYIDKQLKDGNTNVIREIGGNDRDNTPSYGHKVNVPAIVALAWELEKAGNDKNKENMIMDKYASMPLDRFGQIEIIDKDLYKREYSEYEIGQQLGDNALGKIRNAYTKLKAYTDSDTHDLGLFNHFVDPFDNETLVKIFKDSSLYSDDEGNLDIWNYVWDEKEKDFKAEKTGDKIAKKDIKDEQLTDVVFSGRGIFLRVNNPEGSYWYIKVNPKGGRAKVIEDNWKTMKEVIEAARKIMYKTPDELTEQDMNNYIGYKQYMQDIAIEIKKQIAESFRGTTTEKVKY